MDIIKRLFTLLIDLVIKLAGLIKNILTHIMDKFLEVTIAEKIIFINSLFALLTVTMPVARFYIFETYYDINNPVAIYLILIIIFMLASIYFAGKSRFIIRLLINAYYLFWIIYMPLAGELTKANPYEITPGYYMNIAAPAVFMAASLVSYYINRE